MDNKMVSKNKLLKYGINLIRAELNRASFKNLCVVGKTVEAMPAQKPDVRAIDMVVTLLYVSGILSRKQKNKLQNIIERNLNDVNSQISGVINVPISEYENSMQNL